MQVNDLLDDPLVYYADASVFRYVECDGEYLFYHSDSGETHFLNAAGAGLLKRLSKSSARVEDLMELLDEQVGDPSCSHDNLKALLDRFEALGVVFKCRRNHRN